MTSVQPTLIYICISYNNRYIHLLDILLKSIYKYTPIHSMHIYIIACKTTRPLVEDLINVNQYQNVYIKSSIPCINHLRNNKNAKLLEAACQKLLIFEHNIDIYTNILYLDTDIISTGDISPIFNLPQDHKIYTLPEGKITLNGKGSGPWGGKFFRNDKKYINHSGINSGIMAFRVCDSVSNIFKITLEHIHQHLHSGKPIPGCKEQPFLSYNTIVNNMINNNDLPTYAMLHPRPVPENTYKLLNHFSGWVGDADYKIKKMKQFYEKYIK